MTSKLCSLLLLILISFATLAQEVKIPWTVDSFRDSSGELIFAASFKLPANQSFYWRHPGIAGAAPQVHFLLNDRSLNLEETSWPQPERKILAANLHSYIVRTQLTLFYRVPGDIQDKIYDQDIRIQASWLTCSDVCLQGQDELQGHFIHDHLTLSPLPSFSFSKEQLQVELDHRPKKATLPADLDLMLGKDEMGNTILFYSTSQKNHARFKRENLIYPYTPNQLTFSSEKLYHDRSDQLYGMVTLQGDVQFPLTLDLYLNFSPSPIIVSKEFKGLTADLSTTLKSMSEILTEIPIEKNVEEITSAAETETSEHSSSLWYIFLMAFLGGLILNVMPCVLPVLSLKLFGLIKINGASRKEILVHNFLYTLGILLSFAILAIFVIVIKSSGEAIGWGFQMQSPKFLLVMIMALTIFSLNLFGLFEFRTPGGSLFGNIKIENKHWGSFFSGILAVILSTPCSAPFLGTALTFAFTTSNPVLFTLLMVIGLGLAFPIILVGVIPRAINLLPKPGEWMNHLKKFLGLSLALTALWLITIFYTLSSSVDQLLPISLLGVSIGSITLYFIWQRKKANHKAWPLMVLSLIITFFLMFSHYTPQATAQQGNGWIGWSEKLMEEQQGKNTLFIKLYADWCLTCKVDQQLILEGDGFKDLVKNHQLILLAGDYTSSYPELDQWMKKHKIVSVPAYIIQKKNGELIKIDGQLTIDKVKQALQ